MSEFVNNGTQADPYAAYLPAIDVNDGLKRIMNNKKLYFSLLGRFKMRQMADDLLQKMEKNTDATEIQHAAHAIKGAAGNLGLTLLRDITVDIESMAKAGTDCRDKITVLREAVKASEDAVASLLAEKKS